MTKPAQYWKRVGEGIVERAPDQFLAQTWRGGPSKTFRTKASAKAWRRETMAKRDRGEPVMVRRSIETVGAECQRWLDAQRAYLQAPTIKIYRSRVTHQVNHPRLGIGAVRLVELSHERVERWCTDLQASGLHPRTINQARSVLSRVLDDAVRANPPRLGNNVVRYARPLPQAPEEPVDAPNLAHVFALIDALPAHHRIVAELALGAGLRLAEALGAMPGDVNEDSMMLHVQRQYLSGAHTYALPKGQKTRWVPIDATLVAKLRAHQRDHGLSRTGTYAVLLNGGQLGERQWSDGWDRARRTAGVDLEGVHQLRHAFGSYHVAAGESLANVARWMGHASTATTHRYYVHAVPDTRPTTDLLARSAASARTTRTKRALKLVN